jgi:hypothetical protein
VKENIAKTAQAYQRLLTQPVKPRDPGIFWVNPNQIEDELTPAEKSLVLATFEGGKFTLADWFWTVHEIVPPGRPRDLTTPEGADKFADRALEGPVLMAEAIGRGYDKSKKYIDAMRTVEDDLLLNKFLTEKTGRLPDPNESQIKAYYAAHTSSFDSPASAKIDQIWCKDLATAQKARELLAGGTAFQAVKNELSLRKDEQARDTSATAEGVFWDDIRKAEPNTVIGPIKGFFDPRIKWRIVRVLEKKPATPMVYSDSIKGAVQQAFMMERFATLRQDLEKQTLAKYPHEVFAEKIKDIDPLEVSTDDAPARS